MYGIILVLGQPKIKSQNKSEINYIEVVSGKEGWQKRLHYTQMATNKYFRRVPRVKHSQEL